MKITMTNWDDIVRAEKRKAPIKSITWGTHGWGILSNFIKVRFAKSSKEGIIYFGIRHYHDPTIDGYTVQR